MTRKTQFTPHFLILAGGGGTRMRSPIPKVLHPVGGRPILGHVVHAIRAAGFHSAAIAVVTPPQTAESPGLKIANAVREMAQEFGLSITTVEQPNARGTGDAVRCALASNWGKNAVSSGQSIVVLPGDFPLLTPDLIQAMAQPLAKSSGLRLLTAQFEDPFSYGRIVRKSGRVQKIVEEKDATARERLIQEVALSIYAFEPAFISKVITRLDTRNAQNEFYLTDTIPLALKLKKKVEDLKWKDAETVHGVNTQWELSAAGKVLNRRVLKSWADRGVRFIDPDSTWVDPDVELSEEVVVHPGVVLTGNTRVMRGVTLGANVQLHGVRVEERVIVKRGCVAEDAVIESDAQVGPYVHLRPGSKVGKKVKLGNFVELKNSIIGDSTSVAHLSYLGDAVVGARVNIGCGFITCNFDGREINGKRKHTTVIEDDVFMGSDCQTIAPIKVGRGSYVASGSTLTEDVEADSLAIARTRQVNKPGYAKKLRQNVKGK